jgi:hypothetical protein
LFSFSSARVVEWRVDERYVGATTHNAELARAEQLAEFACAYRYRTWLPDAAWPGVGSGYASDLAVCSATLPSTFCKTW